MKYHYKPPRTKIAVYGEIYKCDHPVYSSCTLYKIYDLGLAVIQQRYDPETKSTTWTEIDKELQDSIYLKKGFKRYFEQNAGKCEEDGLYPTVTIRQVMWALRMKPLLKERWETVFDRKDI